MGELVIIIVKYFLSRPRELTEEILKVHTSVRN